MISEHRKIIPRASKPRGTNLTLTFLLTKIFQLLRVFLDWDLPVWFNGGELLDFLHILSPNNNQPGLYCCKQAEFRGCHADPPIESSDGDTTAV